MSLVDQDMGRHKMTLPAIDTVLREFGLSIGLTREQECFGAIAGWV